MAKSEGRSRALPARWNCVVVVVGWALFAAGGVQAQGSLDKLLFDGVYDVETPAFRRVMRLADDTAYPLFAGGAAAAWAGAWLLRDDDFSDAYRLTVSEAGALVAAFGLKYVVRRTRPYVRFDDVETRGSDIARVDPWSFPSGHSAVAFAMATSFSLSHPRWYVVVPGYLWATTVALSRVWLGVHYPGDVLAGAVLGTAVAVTVHHLGPRITPGFLRSGNQRPHALRLRLHVAVAPWR